MSLNKKQRKLVFDKSNGVCWYCGNNLPEKGWHADHVEPVRRYKNVKITDEGVKYFTKMERPHLDTIKNIVPSCSKCNLFKNGYSIEGFRREISLQVERARRFSVNFRTAERFGLIVTKDKPVVFWFETNQLGWNLE